MTLPEAFIEDIRPYLPADELADFIHALTEAEPTTCIRYNPQKVRPDEMQGLPIGWNSTHGRYLAERPNFTLDPLMHSGAYYVQEASSQFVTHLVRSLVKTPAVVLDLCAAPGGKSTAMLSALPEGSQLVSNEIDRRRARILAENVTKWGLPDVTVTSNAPADFSGLTHQFDVILTDVPCSGEGMFRKDEGAVKDWSPQKVNGCVALQRDILADIWPTLKPGGLLIYGTCTFNVHEDEEMLQYICEELGAEAIDVPVDPSWHIHPPLKGQLPCYRFMPHFTQGEGLFMAALRKTGSTDACQTPRRKKDDKRRQGKPNGKERGHDKGAASAKPALDLKKLSAPLLAQLDCDATLEGTLEGTLRAVTSRHRDLHDALAAEGLYLLQSGVEMGTIKGKDVIPAHALALSTVRRPEAFPEVEVTLETALNYLRHEAVTLSADQPTGYVILTYHGHALGFVKNLGNRSNNLYPQEWRIRHL